MSSVSLPQLVTSLRVLLSQVDRKTHADTPLDDGHGRKQGWKDWLETADVTIQVAKDTVPEFTQLVQFQLALRYRTQQMKKEAPPCLKQDLISILQKLFPNGASDEFIAKQIGHLCSKYADFAQVLLKPGHEALVMSFFKFCIQALSLSSHRKIDLTHWVDIFVEYPEVAERLMKSSLYLKLGHFPENIDIDGIKGVCIKMHLGNGVMWVPIKLTNENLATRICLKNQTTLTPTLTLGEMFKQFEDPSPDLDVSDYGIINLNSNLLGSKDSKGALELLDPAKWIEYKPSVVLEWPELRKLYPEIPEWPELKKLHPEIPEWPELMKLYPGILWPELKKLYPEILELPELMKLNPEITGVIPYGFVLRAHLGFFDFVMRLNDGKYRVISITSPLKTDSLKAIFYPLIKEQGEKIVRMVADHIQKNQNAHKERKQISPIDVQPYINEVLGHAFYDHLRHLIKGLNPLNLHQTEAEVNDHLAQVIHNLDPDAFEQFMSQVVKKLVNTSAVPKIHQLIYICLKTIYSVHPNKDKIFFPSEEEVRVAFTKDKQNRANKITESLLALTRLCFEVLHPFSVTALEAEKDTPFLGRLFRIVEAIPWKWLKDLLTDVLLLILGPFRGYHYRTVTAKKPLAKLVQSVCNLKPENRLNRAYQLLKSYSNERSQQVYQLIDARLTVLTANKY